MKVLSRPKGNAEEYGRWSVNPYVGCPHGCTYCYLKKGVWANALGGNVATLKKGVVNEEHAYHLAMTEIIEYREEIIRDGGLFMTFTSDPCVPETCELFFRIASKAMGLKIPVTMLTKNADFCNKNNNIFIPKNAAEQISAWIVYIAMSKEDYQNILAIGFTLTGHDELEPNASPNTERIEAMKYLNREGWKTWASIEPVIDFPSALDMVQQAVNAGCQHFKIGLLTSNTRVCRDRYDVRDCLHFVEDVMHVTAGKATVYWKQSVRDLFNGDGHIILDRWENAVGKDWSMFTTTNSNDYEQETIQTGDSGA